MPPDRTLFLWLIFCDVSFVTKSLAQATSLPAPGLSPSVSCSGPPLLRFPPSASPYPPALSELIFLTLLGRLVITVLSRNPSISLPLVRNTGRWGVAWGLCFASLTISASGETSGRVWSLHWTPPGKEVSGLKGGRDPFFALSSLQSPVPWPLSGSLLSLPSNSTAF